jgi:hypothetical protein
MDEAWMRFEMTGRVEDYLKFKGSDNFYAGAATGSGKKERPDGAEYSIDRNGSECNANWRL